MNLKFLKKVLIWCIVLGLIVVFMYITDIKCIIKATIGVPCPTCGMTRAWISVLHLDFAQAFKWHPIFPIAIVVVYLIIDNGNPKKWFKMLLMFTVILLLAVYIYRIITLGLSTPPLDINKNSLLFRAIGLFR
jgi:hypothetical protein